ncbi:MAG: diacylglycerol kinase family protein, partial [Myxococcales bacterium]|nr:diacylglycerol kinase family protein [Myxococcales bacterium]
MFEPEMTVVIANPAAGHGFVGNNWPTLGAKIQEVLGPVRLRLTESVGHGTEIARDAAAEGARTIISFGGDGTHS